MVFELSTFKQLISPFLEVTVDEEIDGAIYGDEVEEEDARIEEAVQQEMLSLHDLGGEMNGFEGDLGSDEAQQELFQNVHQAAEGA
jgi:hypothetical protein